MLAHKFSVSQADQEAGTGGPDPPSLKNHKHMGFLGNICPDPQKNHKASKAALNLMPSFFSSNLDLF